MSDQYHAPTFVASGTTSMSDTPSQPAAEKEKPHVHTWTYSEALDDRDQWAVCACGNRVYVEGSDA